MAKKSKKRKSAFASIATLDLDFVETEEERRGPPCFERRDYDPQICTGRFCFLLEECENGHTDRGD